MFNVFCTSKVFDFLKDVQKSGFNEKGSDAAMAFLTDMLMYKQHDYRCLKPNPKVPSSEWGHYDMHGFRAAKSTKELGQ